MDDPATYGPEFHRLPFSRAVEQDLLSDYKVVVLAMSERHVDGALQAHLAAGGGEINLTDAAKIVGCWRALQNPENRDAADGPVRPLGRAIAFTNTIKSSKLLETHWDGIVAQAVEMLPGSGAAGGVPLRNPPCRRAASRARPQGADRVAEGPGERNLPHPVKRAVPVRRHRRAGARRGAVHEPAQQPGGYRPGRGPRHAQGAGQGRTATSCCRSRCRPASRRRRRSTTTNGSPRSGACCVRCARTMTGWMPRSTRSTSTTGRRTASSSPAIRMLGARRARRGASTALPAARFSARRDLREDRREVRGPEVLGELGQGRRRHLRAPGGADRRAARQPRERGASASGSRRSTASSGSRSTSRSTATAPST